MFKKALAEITDDGAQAANGELYLCTGGEPQGVALVKVLNSGHLGLAIPPLSH